VLAGLTPGTLTSRVDYTHVEVQRQPRELYVTVLDGDEQPVEGLSERQFVVQEDSVDRETLRASRATAAMQVAILVDTGSAARQLIGDFRRGIDRFVQELHADNEISLIGFGGNKSVLAQSSSNLALLQSGIAKLYARPDSASYLVNALADTAKDFQRRDATRPVVVVVTTSGVDFSDQEAQPIVTRLRSSGAALHAVVVRTSIVKISFQGTVGLSAFPSWANRARDVMLDIGPEQTGGRRIDISTVNGLAGVLARLAAQLPSQYLVVYASPQSLVAPQAVQVGDRTDEPVTVRAVAAR
jgi:VWFA-related protein